MSAGARGGGTDFGKADYLALLAARDARIRRLGAEGFAFVTNAFRPGMAPAGVRDAERIAADLRRQGFEVELSDGYDEAGTARPALCGIWRRRPTESSGTRSPASRRSRPSTS